MQASDLRLLFLVESELYHEKNMKYVENLEGVRMERGYA